MGATQSEAEGAEEEAEEGEASETENEEAEVSQQSEGEAEEETAEAASAEGEESEEGEGEAEESEEGEESEGSAEGESSAEGEEGEESESEGEGAEAEGSESESEESEEGEGEGSPDSFRQAVQNSDGQAAHQAWASLSQDQKTAFDDDQQFVATMLTNIGVHALKPFKQMGASFADAPSYVTAVLDQLTQNDAGQWISWMKGDGEDSGDATAASSGSSLWDDFVAAIPEEANLGTQDPDERRAVEDLLKAGGPDDGKAIFHKVYGIDLNNGAPWTSQTVAKLYEALLKLPPREVATLRGGISLHTGQGAAYTPGNQGAVLATVNAAQPQSHPREGSVPAGCDEFTDNALHEVGHGCGHDTQVGGQKLNDAVAQHIGWEGIDAETWCNALWTDAANDLGGDGITSDSMYEFCKGTLDGTLDMPAGRRQRHQQALGDWSSVPLCAWVASFLPAKQLRAAWNFADACMAVGDHYHLMRVVSQQWNQTQFVRVHKWVFENRVSDYALNSPAEWFAEHYAYYYRNNQSDPCGIIDDALQGFLDAAANGG